MYLNRPPHRCKSAGSMRRATIFRTDGNGSMDSNNSNNGSANGNGNGANNGSSANNGGASGGGASDANLSPSRSNSDKWADRRARLKRHVSDLTW